MQINTLKVFLNIFSYFKFLIPIKYSFQQIKGDIDMQTRPVAQCLEQVRQLVLTSNVLSIAEVTTLENSGRQLRARVDRAFEVVSRLLKHLLNGYEELDKLQNELQVFNKWLHSAQVKLADEEKYLSDLNQLPEQALRIKELLKEIIAYQADLRFITISTQKFVGEGKDYLQVLNDLRLSLTERLPHIEPVPSFKSPIRQTVSNVTVQYNELLNNVNSFAERQHQIDVCYHAYQDSLFKAKNWLSDVSVRVSATVSNPVATDIETIQEQANIAKSLYNEFLANGRLIDGLQQNLDSLLTSLIGAASAPEISSLEIPVDQVKKDYKHLLDVLDGRCKMLDMAFVQAQSVQDALDGLTNNIKMTEEKLIMHLQPASLIADHLQVGKLKFIYLTKKKLIFFFFSLKCVNLNSCWLN